jgi:hypothetical protein
MNKYYVVDLYLKKYYGPFKNCKKAKSAARFIKEVEVSDWFLEIGTNILVVDEGTFSYSYYNFEKGNLEEMKKQFENESFTGEQLNAIY